MSSESVFSKQGEIFDEAALSFELSQGRTQRALFKSSVCLFLGCIHTPTEAKGNLLREVVRGGTGTKNTEETKRK